MKGVEHELSSVSKKLKEERKKKRNREREEKREGACDLAASLQNM